MSNANKIARYITTINRTPSNAISVFVFKPMTVAATFFFMSITLFHFFWFYLILSKYHNWLFRLQNV